MPLYPMVCDNCGASGDIVLQMSEVTADMDWGQFKCSSCGNSLRRVYTVPNDPNACFTPGFSDELSDEADPVFVESREHFNHLMSKKPELVRWEKGMGRKEKRKPWSERPGNDKHLDKLTEEVVQRVRA